MNYKKAPHTKSLSNCASLLTAGCGSDETVTNPSRAIRRGDDAVQLKINLSGSLQNPAFSPTETLLYSLDFGIATIKAPPICLSTI